MAKEYIEKEALMAKIDAWEESARNGTNPNCKNGNEYEAAMDIAIMVEEAPVADVRENVQAEWVRDNELTYHCSACNHLLLAFTTKYENFCPNCGAQMGGAEDG